MKTKKPPSPLLPTECMEQIFNYLLQVEDSKLYPSLLVNRYWCKNVVPFLWNRPFSIVSNQNCFKLLRTFFLCFNNEEFNLLNSLLNPYKIKIPSSNFNHQTKLNYSIYLQELSFKDLEICVSSTIHKWYGKNSYNNYYPDQMKILLNSLLKFFFKKSTNLYSLNLDTYFDFLDIPNFSNYFSQSQYDCVYLTETSMILLNNLHNLKNLYLYYCEGLSNTILDGSFILQKLHIIYSLKLQNITLSMLRVYGKSLRQLGLNIHDLEVAGDIAFNYCTNINELVLIIYNPTHLTGYDTWKKEKWKERLDQLVLSQRINLSSLSIHDNNLDIYVNRLFYT
ncbi:6170_t:CDS:2 [Rhizophagus irregularis]|nr:6170_t:CDS:2 [Rhizophagus irregularis]